MTATIYFVAASLASGHALLNNKRDPSAVFGWVVVCWMLPIVGAGLYALFGINRVKTRGRRLQGLIEQHGAPMPAHDISLPLTQLQRTGGAVTGLPLLLGNQLEPLENGDQAYPAMLDAIEKAQHSVWLASYIFTTTGWCQRFLDALASATRRGVQVRVLVDGFGEFYSLRRPVKRLRSVGVPAARFLPPKLLPPSLSINLRNHRKLLVIDGELAFAGGMNIDNRHLLRNRGLRMRDLHFLVRGPVVAQLGDAFRRDWRFATGEKLAPQPSPGTVGKARCRVITDGPDDNLDKLALTLVSAIASAHQRICIATPYFLPPRELTAALQAAALRGVAVEVLLPTRSNLRYVDWASRHMLGELLSRGVQVRLLPAPFSHSKLLIVDSIYALIGSANLDPRSLYLNFELGIEVFDSDTCARLQGLFDRDYASSPNLQQTTLSGRSVATKLRDSAAWLFSPYL